VTASYADAVNRLAVAVENPSGGVSPSSACPAVGGSWCEQFGYDGYGNRWVNTYSLTVSGQTSTAPWANTPTAAGHFDAANHLTVNGAGPDPDGNLQQIGSTQYTYDAENRLVTVTNSSAGGTVATYAYDGEGRRVQKVAGATTTYVYDAMGELAAEYATGTTQAPPCATCYLTADHLV